MSEPVTTRRRRDYVESFPNWVRLGDSAALVLILAILMGGVFSLGYASRNDLRGWAWLGCALLGVWSLAGVAAGRWDGWRAAPARWCMAVVGVFLAWTGLQLLPLPVSVVGVLSPPWAEVLAAQQAIGLEPPTWVPLAQSPAMGWESWNQALAMTAFFSCALMLAARRACVKWLIVMVSLLVLAEGFLGIHSFFFTGDSRARGFLYNPNHHAALMMAGLPLYFAGLVQWSRNSDRFTGSLFSGSNPLLLLHGVGVLALAGWAASLSVSSLLFGGAIFAGWLLLEYQGQQRQHEAEPLPLGVKAFVGGVVCVAVLAAALMFESTRVPEELAGRAMSNRQELAGGRLAFAEATLEGMMQAPMAGLGLRGAEHAMTRHGDQPTVLTAIWTHNDPVQVVAELGFVGTLLVGGTLIIATVAVGREWAARRRAFDWSEGLLTRATLAGLATVFLHSLTDFHLRIPLLGFTVLILLAMVIRQGPLLLAAFRKY